MMRGWTEWGSSGSAASGAARKFFDPGPLIDEVRHTLADGFGASLARTSGGVGNEFQYVPMMVSRTPVSLQLLDALLR